MCSIVIVTQSGSDLTPELAVRNGIFLLPDRILTEEKEYLNNIDIGPEVFFALLDRGGPLPKTAHPNPEEFRAAFLSLREAEDIICLVMSAETTGTISSALLAKRELEEQGFGPRIHVVDSRHVSLGLGLMALEAAGRAAAGESARDILALLQRMSESTRVVFAMRSLEYARKGGRIGNVSARAVAALGVVPVLSFRKGNVYDYCLSRSFGRAVDAQLKLMEKEYRGCGRVAVFHASAPQEAQRLCDRVLEKFPQAEVGLYAVGPAVGLYTGRGCIGLAYTKGECL